MNDSTWTWISGTGVASNLGNYGEKGITNITNLPRARYDAVGWYDSLREEFWLFGGVVGNSATPRAYVYQPEY